MSYPPKNPAPYVSLGDYSILPDGSVLIRNHDLPEEIQKRIIEDVKKEQEREAQRKDFLYFK